MRKRPCGCDKCRLCWLFNNDPKYHKMWGGTKDLPPPPPMPPSFFRQAVNYAAAVIKHVVTGRKTLSEEQTRIRLQICEGTADTPKCEYYNGNNRCLKCGCGLSKKASWADQDCPIGKWPKVEVKD